MSWIMTKPDATVVMKYLDDEIRKLNETMRSNRYEINKLAQAQRNLKFTIGKLYRFKHSLGDKKN